MNYTRTQSHAMGNYVLLAGIALLLCFIVMYVALVFKTVSFTANRQHAHKDMGEITVKLGELESKYISLKNGITSERALELGFKEVAAKRYISKPSLGLSRRSIE